MSRRVSRVQVGAISAEGPPAARGSGTPSPRAAPDRAPRGRCARWPRGPCAGPRCRRRGARSRRAASSISRASTSARSRCAIRCRIPRSPKSEPTRRAMSAIAEASPAAFLRRPTSPRSSRAVITSTSSPRSMLQPDTIPPVEAGAHGFLRRREAEAPDGLPELGLLVAPQQVHQGAVHALKALQAGPEGPVPRHARARLAGRRRVEVGERAPARRCASRARSRGRGDGLRPGRHSRPCRTGRSGRRASRGAARGAGAGKPRAAAAGPGSHGCGRGSVPGSSCSSFVEKHCKTLRAPARCQEVSGGEGPTAPGAL